ncbi:MAG: DUF2911 domain-containing protein [Saprospiraceae bacterium]
MNMRYSFLSLLVVLIPSLTIFAQDLEFPDLDKSPMDAAHYPRSSAFANYLDDDDPDRTQKIKVLYCRPYKKGRKVFGELEKFGIDWRLGANEATEVTFYTPVEIDGTVITAGTYTMFAELHPSYWIIKISKERFIAGVENRDKTKDIVAVRVNVAKTKKEREEFTIGFQKVDEGNVNMLFEWDNTRAALPINLNAPSLSGSDASPMDLAQYPRSSRFRNYAKPEELDKTLPKVRIVYSRPQMKGRKIFGELLKFGEMWRVGANQTTELTFFQKVKIGDTEIRPGRYGLFATVNEDNWEFVVHRNVQSWGPANHDEKDNIVTVKVKTKKTPSTLEALSMTFEEKDDQTVDLIVGWENTMTRLPIMIIE